MTLGVSTIIYICRYTFLFFFGVFVMFDSMCLRGREVFCYFFLDVKEDRRPRSSPWSVSLEGRDKRVC